MVVTEAMLAQVLGKDVGLTGLPNLPLLPVTDLKAALTGATVVILPIMELMIEAQLPAILRYALRSMRLFALWRIRRYW